ncbi:Mu-like prophage major head subunit gpT family protein [Tropicibacter naphthalenivorans]|uniref:Mu-like prophage major head subunit gpT n=1 Tax=Tropicibacter naphthalenivorans TaxID=441103 RepID=A0A0N7M0K5_9RHOB|nr:Mu-like prophage major head subunit gpT family protein [Tropicibacter naphthalenivorans]CUH80721.1 Mu-like prophage major head subunit gpT [Tropicibacter naphthalenivorans]SMC89557.1 Mu-like prophage major head subunit gpT [Tropicibacter naphthalenivorans]
MIVNASNLALAFKGFKSVYTDAFLNAPVDWDKIAMVVNSDGSEEEYGWLGAFPQLREWIGPREVKSLTAHGFAIRNRKFESTISVSREKIEDDKLGVFKPMFSEMGQLAKTHPEEMIFALLAAGFDTECFDGQNYFDTDHPGFDKNVEETTYSNMQDGTGEPWFLLDTSRAVRPIIWQERVKYEFTEITAANDTHVFLQDEYVYGVRARVNAGFGLWQLAFGSKAELNTDNYASARAAMMNFRSSEGRILGVKPKLLLVPPSMESAALKLVNSDLGSGGETNEWKGTADLIVTPYLAA